MKNNINLSNLSHTWIFDLDGTLVYHNGHLTEEGDSLLPGVKEFFNKISNDYVIILTAREEKYKKQTEMFLDKNDIKYDLIIYDIPHGERLLFNDKKNSGLKTSFSYNLERNCGLTDFDFHIREDL
jgi:hypothetical protein